jgi:hypothetical protein
MWVVGLRKVWCNRSVEFGVPNESPPTRAVTIFNAFAANLDISQRNRKILGNVRGWAGKRGWTADE